MSPMMKVLIAYDGSSYADAALDDLSYAGLPQEVEARILSVADVFLPPPSSSPGFPAHVPPAVQRAWTHATQASTTRIPSRSKRVHVSYSLSLPGRCMLKRVPIPPPGRSSKKRMPGNRISLSWAHTAALP